MRTLAVLALALGSLVSAADNAKDQRILKDRQATAGTWRAVGLEIDGNQAAATDAAKITVVNRADGTWTVLSEGNPIGTGTSQIDPTKKPRTIDFTPADGAEQGKTFRGIYELDGNTRKLCFAGPGKERPAAFASEPGSGHTLVTFKREKR